MVLLIISVFFGVLAVLELWRYLGCYYCVWPAFHGLSAVGGWLYLSCGALTQFYTAQLSWCLYHTLSVFSLSPLPLALVFIFVFSHRYLFCNFSNKFLVSVWQVLGLGLVLVGGACDWGVGRAVFWSVLPIWVCVSSLKAPGHPTLICSIGTMLQAATILVAISSKTFGDWILRTGRQFGN